MSHLKIKKYSYEFILEFKDATVESDKLNYILNKINESFLTSTDYQINKYKKDNYVPLRIKKKEKLKLNKNELFVKKINSILNKLTGVNLKKMSDKIMKSNIQNFYMLNYLSDSLFKKILDEPSYIDKYIEIVELLSTSNKKWTFEKDEVKYNFKKLILNLCQNKFESLLENDYLDKLDVKNVKKENEDDYYLEKKRITCCVKLISYLYSRKLLSSKVYKSCLGLLLSKENNLYYELCFKMMDVSYKYMKKNDKTYFNLCLKKLKESLNNKKIMSRVKYGIEDFIDKNKVVRKKKKEKEKEKKKININSWKGVYTQEKQEKLEKKEEKKKETDEDIIYKIRNLIKEYISHKNYDETTLYLKDMKINNRIYLLVNGIFDFIYDANDKEINESILLLKLFIKNKDLSLKMLKQGIEDSLLGYSDLIIDFPMIKDYWSNILNELMKNKYISFNYITRITKKNLDELNYKYITESLVNKN